MGTGSQWPNPAPPTIPPTEPPKPCAEGLPIATDPDTAAEETQAAQDTADHA